MSKYPHPETPHLRKMSLVADRTDGHDQDPPAYGPPAGVLILPAVEFLAPDVLRPSATFGSSSLAHLHLTPLQAPPLLPSPTPSASSSHPRTPSPRSPRPRSHTVGTGTGTRRIRARDRPRASAPAAMSAPSTSPPPSSSPPPYSLVAPEVASAPARRAASSPHLRLPDGPSHSRLEYARTRAPPNPTSDEDESGADTDDGVMFRRPSQAVSFADTLRNRLLRNGKGRAVDEHWSRPITTAPGVSCAGETETEGEDSPRNLPTARITPSTLSRQLKLPPSTAWIVPILFQLFRLLAIVPAVFGMLWNLYHVLRPPGDRRELCVDYTVSVLWSILTGWQCLQLTTGLLKRWRVYYSPFAALIRLLALQAICWPATHLTLTILDSDARPLICWAAIGTTTCCSRAVQLWVTSNIVPSPPPPGAPAQEEELLRKGRRRRWDWAQVGRKCALPAGVVYFVMAWALVLRSEFESDRRR